MNYASYIALIPLLPLVSFLVLGIGGRGRFKHSAGWIATLLLAVSAGLALFTAYQYFMVEGKIDGAYPTLTVLQHDWLRFSPSVSINMGMVIDPLSVMMLVVVTMVSFMVHLFSLGYMHGEERFSTYYAFLGLFTFSMLGLVVSSNIFQIYIFWELVGVSSYLLIGFYYQKASAVAAAKKAFIVTRFADLGFLVGILILGFNGNTLDFNTLIQRLTDPQSPYLIGMTTSSFLGISMISWALVLVFVGGAGKSAMFPLHIWLPDAMEGPTPVSALIHAATMVVAGVFLVARMFPLFYVNHLSLQVVTWVGAASALFAALIACTQTDIKRVLAYSTMSQIGYMMFALGVSGYGGEAGLGYTGSLFHLFTHAFFKSLLFLGASAKFAVKGKTTGKKDLAMQAIAHGNAYVAQIAMGANDVHALKTILEAEAFPGSSIIIAYSHCIAHGYDMCHGLDQQKLAVNSGYWPLFRYNPLNEKGKRFSLDCKNPTVPLDEFLYHENRFATIKSSNPDMAGQFLNQANEGIKLHWERIEALKQL